MRFEFLKPWTAAVKWVVRLWVLLVCLKFVGCIFMVTGPWGPEVGGRLPNGHAVYFQARPRGRETDDRLTWIDHQGIVRRFWVDQIHAGFSFVTIKYADGGNLIWVEADGEVGASLDLISGDFRFEQQPQLPGAIYGQGQTLAAGRTWSVSGALGPW
jgi:hypothetical protein